MNAICLVTVTPTNEWCDYLNRFTRYKIYIVVDDNNFDYTLYKRMYPNLFFIKFQHDSYKANGYKNTQFDNSSWDKALYYFAVENKTHKYVWFIDSSLKKYSEEDINTVDLNQDYNGVDLFYNRYIENRNCNKDYWLWDKINIKGLDPYYNASLMIARMSRDMLSKINNYATQHKELFYIEALLPTISIHNNLWYLTPKL